MGKEPSKDLPGVRNSEQERVGDRNSSIISAASFHGQEGVEEQGFLNAFWRERGLRRLPRLISH